MEEKILITGSEGFVGSHLTKHLAKTHPLYFFDIKFGDGYNIIDFEDILNKLDLCEPDIVIHLAANPSVVESRKEPYYDLSVNAIGTLNLVTALNELKQNPYLIFTSTAQVYGEPQTLPIDESHPINPKSPYAHTKFTAEGYIRLYYDNYTILRPFNIYGPNQQLGNVIPDFVERAKHCTENNHVFDVYGSEFDTRDFIYVDDLTKLVELLIDKQPQGTFNVGSGTETYIRDVALKLLILLDKKCVLNYVGRPNDKVSRMLCSNHKIWSTTGWTPEVGIDWGLLKCL